jgi:CRP-like cAMP-binding protein
VNPQHLKRCAPFAGLSEEELELLEELLEPQRLVRGQPLQREGTEAEGLVLVEQGALRLETAREGVLVRCEAGSVLGALALVRVGTRMVSAVAEDETRVRVLSRTAFHRLTEDAPRAACRILEAILGDVAGAMRAGVDPLRG